MTGTAVLIPPSEKEVEVASALEDPTARLEALTQMLAECQLGIQQCNKVKPSSKNYVGALKSKSQFIAVANQVTKEMGTVVRKEIRAPQLSKSRTISVDTIRKANSQEELDAMEAEVRGEPVRTVEPEVGDDGEVSF